MYCDMVMMKKVRKAGVPMEKQRMFKMSQLEQDMLVKALCDTQKEMPLKQAEEIHALMDKTMLASRRRLYLSDREFQLAVLALNWKRSAYLSIGRSSVGFDRILLKLLNSKYRRAPVR